MKPEKLNEELNEEIVDQNTEETTEETENELTETEKAQLEVKEAKDKYLRLYSEFENFRRRTAKEKIDIVINANEGLVKDLLPVIDDFQRALAAMENADDVDSLKEGVEIIFNKFYKVLENKGLKKIESIGQPFDVELHESVTQFPAGEDKKGLVVDELEKGYFLNDKVIRYSKVVVGN